MMSRKLRERSFGSGMFPHLLHSLKKFSSGYSGMRDVQPALILSGLLRPRRRWQGLTRSSRSSPGARTLRSISCTARQMDTTSLLLHP